MTRLAKPLKEFIEEQDWKDEITEDEERGFAQLSTRIRIANQSCRLFIDTHDERDAIAVHCYLPFNALPDNVVQTCVLANAINRRHRYTRLEIDPDDGELRIVMWTNFADLEPTGRNVDIMVDFCLSIPREWMGTIAEVALAGKPAEQVIAAREAEEAPGEGD